MWFTISVLAALIAIEAIAVPSMLRTAREDLAIQARVLAATQT